VSHRSAWQVLLALFALGPGGCLNFNLWQDAIIPPIPGGESSEASKAELSNRESAKVNLGLAENMEKNGHPLEAIAFFEKTRQLDPRLQNKVARHLAVLYDQLGQSQKALSEYEQALKLAPRDPDLLNSFGYYYYSRGQWAQAEAQLRKAIACSPKHPRAWVNLGMTLAQQQRYAESLDAFGRIVSSAEAYSNVAFILTAQGKREEAKRYYREALQQDPNMMKARLALAKLERPEPVAPVAAVTARPPQTASRPAPEPPPDLMPVSVPEPTRRSNPADAWHVPTSTP
jgi:Tfp pilus assembly protein PilF